MDYSPLITTIIILEHARIPCEIDLTSLNSFNRNKTHRAVRSRSNGEQGLRLRDFNLKHLQLKAPTTV